MMRWRVVILLGRHVVCWSLVVVLISLTPLRFSALALLSRFSAESRIAQPSSTFSAVLARPAVFFAFLSFLSTMQGTAVGFFLLITLRSSVTVVVMLRLRSGPSELIRKPSIIVLRRPIPNVILSIPPRLAPFARFAVDRFGRIIRLYWVRLWWVYWLGWEN